MIRRVLLSASLVLPIWLSAQAMRNSYVIKPIPCARDNIYGFAIGPIGSESVCSPANMKRSHGINLQIIGNGIFQPFKIGRNEPAVASADTAGVTGGSQHNGLLLSTFGTRTTVVNGISISGWMSALERVNGISLDLIWTRTLELNGAAIAMVNEAEMMRGVQIGLINRSRRGNGVQIGLWNRNERGAMPLLNWKFGKGKIAEVVRSDEQ